MEEEVKEEEYEEEEVEEEEVNQATSQEKIIAALNIMRRLPPSKSAKNIQALTSLLPEEADKILSMVDSVLGQFFDSKVFICLEVEEDPNVGKQFIKSEYNRDGDSYR